MLSVIGRTTSAVGLLLNKARNVADEKLRNVIIEDLNDIKTKIHGLARKDLLSSYSLLKVDV